MEISTPKQALAIEIAFQKELRTAIEKNLIDLTTAHGGMVAILEDDYEGYPRIYADDAHCSIMELRAVEVTKEGKYKGRINLVTGPHNRIKKPHCDNLSNGELLQIWDCLINSTQTKV